jgi:FixJ family two-component response regulator
VDGLTRFTSACDGLSAKSPEEINGGGTVFIVDESHEVRIALAHLLRAANYQVCQFESAEKYLEEIEIETPGCLLLDAYLPGISEIVLRRELIQSPGARPVVFLTGSNDIQMGVNAMKAGAVDFLRKPVDETRLLAAIDQALIRDRVQRSRRALDNAIRRRFNSLTRQERRIMTHVICGRLNKQIAWDFRVSTKTIKAHRKRVMSKMGAHSLPELVCLGARVGLAMDLVLDSAAATLKWMRPHVDLETNSTLQGRRGFGWRHFV